MDSKDVNPGTNTGWMLLFTVWILVTIATLGSLFFSEVMGVPICTLCWYQRVAMYPLVLILGIGLLPYDRKVLRYAAGFAAVGWLIALFHVLLVAGIIPQGCPTLCAGYPLFGNPHFPARFSKHTHALSSDVYRDWLFAVLYT